MRNSMRIIRKLPPSNEPTRAAYKKPVIGEGKYIKVLPSVYKPKPAPIPKPRTNPAKKAKEKKEKKPAERQPKCWTEEKNQKLIELYTSGMKINDIAREMGISRGAVVGAVTRLANKGRLESRRSLVIWTDEDLSRMKELRDSGKTFGEIADAMGRTQKAVTEQYRRVYGKDY